MNDSKVLNETTNLVADNSQEQKKEVATSETTNVDEKNLAKNSPTQEDTHYLRLWALHRKMMTETALWESRRKKLIKG